MAFDMFNDICFKIYTLTDGIACVILFIIYVLLSHLSKLTPPITLQIKQILTNIEIH